VVDQPRRLGTGNLQPLPMVLDPPHGRVRELDRPLVPNRI
jgi:hypothetical protein